MCVPRNIVGLTLCAEHNTAVNQTQTTEIEKMAKSTKFRVEVVTPRFTQIPIPNALRILEYQAKLDTLKKYPGARFPVRVYRA